MTDNFGNKEEFCTELDERLTGKVLERDKDLILVELSEAPSCSGCPMSGGCATSKNPGKPVWALDKKGASPGDKVMVHKTGGSHLLATFLLFMMPVIVLLVSLLVFQRLMSYNGSILLSIGTVGLYFAFGKFSGLFKRAGNRFAYQVEMVFPASDGNPEE